MAEMCCESSGARDSPISNPNTDISTPRTKTTTNLARLIRISQFFFVSKIHFNCTYHKIDAVEEQPSWQPKEVVPCNFLVLLIYNKQHPDCPISKPVDNNNNNNNLFQTIQEPPRTPSCCEVPGFWRISIMCKKKQQQQPADSPIFNPMYSWAPIESRKTTMTTTSQHYFIIEEDPFTNTPRQASQVSTRSSTPTKRTYHVWFGVVAHDVNLFDPMNWKCHERQEACVSYRGHSLIFNSIVRAKVEWSIIYGDWGSGPTANFQRQVHDLRWE